MSEDNDGMEEVIKEFLVESYENLDRLDQDFVALEENPNDRERLAAIFRVIHTIKGTCGFLGFGKLEKLTHVGENLLSKLRDGILSLNQEMTTGLLQMVDAVRNMLSSIESAGNDGDKDYLELIQVLTTLLNEGGLSAEKKVEVTATPVEATPVVVSEVKVAEAFAEKTEVAAETTVKASATDDSKKNSVTDTSIRVDVNLLDKLMDVVGELVLSRNQILQFTHHIENQELLAASQRLNIITTELQEGVMKTRMQPIQTVWNKFPRVVRDLATSLDKKIQLEMVGKETEIDKSIIEAIKDPLTHLIRNAVDHGIEMPEKRRKNGKPEEGRIILHAYHAGGQVNIEITDDGGGIDPERIKNKVLEKGLYSPDQVMRMGERELINCIFLPGFSTAEKVTNVSGRGVGMDVVKTNIEKIGGMIDLSSRFGEGSTIKIKIPLTLAIIPALIINCGNNRYAIPQVSIVELVHLDSKRAQKEIEDINGVQVYRLRGRLLPLVNYAKLMNQPSIHDQSESNEELNTNIVVLQADDRQFGLIVDGINDTQEIVVKPLGKLLKNSNCFAGATIMGDGKVTLIMDVLGVAQKANVVSEIADKSMMSNSNQIVRDSVDKEQLLLFETPDNGLGAILLSKVGRLENFTRGAVEKVGNTDVVQYRDEIMPLIHISEILPERRSITRSDHLETTAHQDQFIQAVVYYDGKNHFGFVVDRILDIVEESIKVQKPGSRDGVMGSIVVKNRVVELMDLDRLLTLAMPNLYLETSKVVGG